MKITSTWAAARLALAAAALAISSLAGATSLTLSPSTASAPPSTLRIDIDVHDLALGTAVGAYDITLSYDDSIWSATSVVFSQFLSGPEPLGSIAAADLSVAGRIRLQEVSFITPLDPQPLDVLQPQSFTLASVNFAAVSTGTGAFAITDAALFDQLGDGVAITAVPEPGTAALALLGLAGLGGQVRRLRRTAVPACS